MQPSVQDFTLLSAADRQLIEAEHARLEQFLNDLRDTCEKYRSSGNCFGCDREQVATCQGRLTSFFFDFLDLIAEHFDNEERIMRDVLPSSDLEGYFHQHQAAHARLTREVRELMRESAIFSNQGNPSEAIRRLERKISELFGRHAHVFDDVFLGKAGHSGDAAENPAAI